MEPDDVNDECHQIWEELGSWWDASVIDGDPFHRAFLFRAIEKLLELKGGERVLDAGCGNGSLSRYMAKRGADVLGVDFSSTLLKCAKERSQGIEFDEIDLTDRTKLQKLANRGPFDRIVSSMVLHDMSKIEPFFESLRSLLKPEGTFIFSIPHPCFNGSTVIFEPEGGITVKEYIHRKAFKLRSKPGQPLEQLVFHRPIHDYLNLLFTQGMVMNGFEEPCVDPKLLPEGSVWAKRPEIPPALITRYRFYKSL